MTLFLNKILAIATVAGDAFLVFLVLVIFLKLLFEENNLYQKVSDMFYKYGLWLAFLVSLAAVLGSLYYSEVAGFEPCKLCWLSRIFMFPQVVLLGIALWRKDRGVVFYSMPLSIIGLLVALDQNFLQWFDFSVIPCSSNALAACTKLYVFEFNYVTIPVMSMTSFALLAFIMWFVRDRK